MPIPASRYFPMWEEEIPEYDFQISSMLRPFRKLLHRLPVNDNGIPTILSSELNAMAERYALSTVELDVVEAVLDAARSGLQQGTSLGMKHYMKRKKRKRR